MQKTEIARRQIDGAIRAYMFGDDPIVVASLTAPACQILRDLNRGNPRSISDALTDLVKERGGSTSDLWKEFNDKSGANWLKHARNRHESFDLEAIVKNQHGAIAFCISEYSCQTQTISAHMSAFATYWQRKMRRCERSTFLGEVCTNFDKRLTVRIVDARLAFWSWVLRLLKATKQFLGRLAAKPASPG